MKPKVYKCVKCRKLDAKYRWKTINRLCKYCWNRLEWPHLSKKTNEEFDIMTEQNTKRNIK